MTEHNAAHDESGKYEIARLRLPIQVKKLVKVSDLLEEIYGKGATVKTEDNWLIVHQYEGNTPADQ